MIGIRMAQPHGRTKSLMAGLAKVKSGSWRWWCRARIKFHCVHHHLAIRNTFGPSAASTVVLPLVIANIWALAAQRLDCHRRPSAQGLTGGANGGRQLGAERAVGPASPLAVVHPNQAVGFADRRKSQGMALVINRVGLLIF